MKNKIISIANKLGICDIGVLKAEVFYDLGKFLEKRKSVPMAEQDYNKRINPFLIMENAKSIIVALCSYYIGDKNGNISKYAYGMDYHYVLEDKLSKIADLLEENGYQTKSFCDTGALNDRYLAYKAGLGFIGNNGFLIHPVYGTYTFIGYIITDCEMEADSPITETCLNCGACKGNCPSGAIGEGFFECEKCLSYITQKKGELSDLEISLVKESGIAWGCDICQDVCPHNIYAKKTNVSEFCENVIYNLSVRADISNKEFKKAFDKRAFVWRGKATIIRNLEIIHGNLHKKI